MISQPQQNAGRRAYVNGKVVDPKTGKLVKGGILFADGRIIAVGEDVKQSTLDDATTSTDIAGKLILPGLVDMCVHTGEPGTEYRETLASASRAAAAGGVTTMIVMPDTDPVIDDAAIVDFILRRARDTAIVRVAPMAAITKDLKGKAMSEFGLLKEAGAVALTDGLKWIDDAFVLRTAMSYASTFDMLIVHHTQENRLSRGVMNEGEVSTRLGLSGSPAAAEAMALERDIRLVELTGARYHAAQVSTAASLDIIARAKDKELPVTCGVSINNLLLNELDIGAYRTFFKLTPPLRSEEDRVAMVTGVRDGLVDVIVSGHNPQSADTKRLPFAEAAFGAVGLETLFSGLNGLVAGGDLDFTHLIEACAHAPARLLGLETGTLKPGRPADFLIADLNCSWTVEDTHLKSRSKNSPFERRNFDGRVVETVVAGTSVFTYDPK